MNEPLPTVLVVEQDPEAVHEILLKIEPVLNVHSLRSLVAIDRYIEMIRPEVIVLSDRLQFRARDARAIVGSLRARFRGKILVLTESADPREEALWKERGADACLLHPTRTRPRLTLFSQTVINLAVERQQEIRHE